MNPCMYHSNIQLNPLKLSTYVFFWHSCPCHWHLSFFSNLFSKRQSQCFCILCHCPGYCVFISMVYIWYNLILSVKYFVFMICNTHCRMVKAALRNLSIGYSKCDPIPGPINFFNRDDKFDTREWSFVNIGHGHIRKSLFLRHLSLAVL